MNFHQATFVATYGTGRSLPAPQGAEVAFVGRSNVGKSSLLNRLVYRKGLAKVSAQPGKTTTINFYDVDGHALVDLPGYGYAKVSQAERKRWQSLMSAYFEHDRPIALVVALVDIRHDPSPLDEALLGYLEELALPRLVAFTKADKLSRSRARAQAAQLARALAIPSDAYVVTSSTSGEGIDALRGRIADTLKDGCDLEDAASRTAVSFVAKTVRPKR